MLRIIRDPYLEPPDCNGYCDEHEDQLLGDDGTCPLCKQEHAEFTAEAKMGK